MKYQTTPNHDGAYMPYLRDAKLIRPWAIPGTPGLEHRIGGLEKDSMSGMVSYDGMNHERMVKTRAQKIRNVIEDVPDVEVFGAQTGDLLLLSWGGTYGSVHGAAEELVAQGKKVGHVHLRWLNPLPKNLGEVLKRFKKVLVPEVNDGQLAALPPRQVPRSRSRSSSTGSTASPSRSPSSPPRCSRSSRTFERTTANMSTNGQTVSTALPVYTKKDFESGVDPRWCPGCGDFSIINQVQKTMPNVGVARENIVFVSGIGCSSRFPYYMNNYGMHTLHGRAPSFASGSRSRGPS